MEDGHIIKIKQEKKCMVLKSLIVKNMGDMHGTH